MLRRPRLVLDENRCRRNIERIIKKASSSSTEFRPHFKTHQSYEIGRWFRDMGVSGITVSSPEMASYFASDGWTDITIAFPFYSGMIQHLRDLSTICSLRLFVNSIKDLEHIQESIQNPVRFYIELDTGYGRSGMSSSNPGPIHELIKASEKFPSCDFYGFYIHDGGTYAARDKKSILKIVQKSTDALQRWKKEYPSARVSLGDTPSASVMETFEGIDECTAGNLVFYDRMQVAIGSCSPDDMALFVELPIAQRFQGQNRAIVHGGAVHLSKDSIEINGNKIFGQRIDRSGNSIRLVSGSFLTALSQEHGTLSGIDGLDHDDSVCVAPVHSCLAVNLFSHYETLDGRIIQKKVLS
jgi:D-serine deaminase-like pyridoxal phosphate-dependent protein